MTTAETIKRFDFLGFEYKFFYKTNSSYKTAIGGILSLMLFIGFLLATVFLSRDMFNREKAIVASYDQTSYKASVPLKELNLMVRITDDFGNLLTDDPEFIEELGVEPYLVRYKLKNGEYYPEYTLLPLVQCSEAVLEEHYYEKVKGRFDLSKMMCLDPYETMEDGSKQEISIQGDMVGVGSTTLLFSMTFCYREDSHDPACLKRMERYRSFYVSAFISDAYVQSRNFGDVVKKEERVISTRVSVEYEYSEYLAFTRNFVQEDMGIFGSDIKEYAFAVAPRQTTIMNTIENGTFYSLVMFSTPSFRVTEIRYGKIQDLLASLSGIMNTAILICRTISLFFSRFLFSNSLAAKILESKPTKPETELTLRESQPQSRNSSTSLEKVETEKIELPNIFQFWLTVFFPKTKVSKVKSHSVVMKAMSLERILSLKQEDKEAIK